MRTRFVLALFFLTSSVALGAALGRAAYLRAGTFRDAQAVCFTPVNPGKGNPVVAFNVTTDVCPQIDPAALDGVPGLPCARVVLTNYAATAGQKNWVRGAWEAALAAEAVPVAAQDAP